MANDLFLFDPETNKYTVDRYLKGKQNNIYFIRRNNIYIHQHVDAEERFGTIDSIVVCIHNIIFFFFPLFVLTYVHFLSYLLGLAYFP